MITHRLLKSVRILKKARIFFLLFLCLSCGEQPFFHSYQSIENGHWEKDKEYYFTFEVSDTGSSYRIMVEVRNTALYPYQNLWLFYNQTLPSGIIVKDTAEFMLADDFGKWYGKGFSLFQNEFPIRTGYYFPEEGEYTIGFRQGMRTDVLPGIQKIGLRIEKEE